MAKSTLDDPRQGQDFNPKVPPSDEVRNHAAKQGQSPTAKVPPSDEVKNYAAKQDKVYEKAGNEAASPTGTDPESKDLKKAEKSGGGSTVEVPDDEQDFVNSSSTKPEKGQRRFLRTGRQKAAAGGAAFTALAIAAFFITIVSGPLQFVHIAQILEKFHFANLQNEQSDRFTKAARRFKYASDGEFEKSRLGYVGNKVANAFESKLNESGLESTYSDKFGLLDGYMVDRTSADSPFRGMSDDEAKAAVKERFGLDAVDGGSIKGGSNALKGELVIDASKLSYTDGLKLNYGLLREAGTNKLLSAIGSRMFCERAGCSWHPLSKLASDTKRNLEDWLKTNETEEEEGVQAAELDTTAGKDDASDKADSALGKISDDAKAAEADPDKIPELDGDIEGLDKAGGPAAIQGFICALRSIDQDVGKVKEAQVVLPLIRMAVEAIAVGSQIESGQDVDQGELGQLEQQLTGPDATKQISSWDQATPISEELNGTPGTPTNADGTLTSIGNNKGPFDSFISKIKGVGLACSTVAQGIVGGFSVALDITGIGDVVNAAISAAVQGVAFSIVSNEAAHWFAGQAVNVLATGIDYGNDIDVGAALGASAQALTAGGNAISAVTYNQEQTADTIAWNQEFKQESLADRLFNVNDERSAVSKLIDKTTPSPTHNFATLFTSFLNVGHAFASLPSMFMGTAHAATVPAPYDYGFQQYGFTEQDLDNPMVENPFENACYVTGCTGVPMSDASGNTIKDANGNPVTGDIPGFLTGSYDGGPATKDGQTLITRADHCFGVNIAPDASGNWDVSIDQNTDPSPYNGSYGTDGNGTSYNCSDTSNQWLRLRFFILDTETMNAAGCYEGQAVVGDDEACTSIGFGTNAATATGGTTNGTSGPTTTTTASATIDMTNLYADSTTVACAAGTNDIGIQTGYANGQPVQIRLCTLPNMPSTGEESTVGDPYYVQGANGLAIVNSRVSGAWEALVTAGLAAGVNMQASSSFRTMAHQTCLANGGCGGTAPAPAGYSNHQMGLAIDFQAIYTGVGGQPSSACPALETSTDATYKWMSANAGNFGIKQSCEEAWHWSPTGN